VTTEPPPGWPLPKKADYFVTASWGGAPRVFDMPHQVTAEKKVS